MRQKAVPALAAALIALSPLSVHAQSFEELVEDALERNAPGAAPPPSAVPPRLRVVPAPAEPTLEPVPPPAAPPTPELAAPKPYRPPTRRAEPAEGAAAEAEEALDPLPPPAEAAPAGSTGAPPPASAESAASGGQAKVSMASLKVEEVNAATFAPGAETKRGANPLILKAQILLDRAGASPGVLDGVYGSNVAKAIAAVETVLGLPVDGKLDENVWAALGGDAAPPVLVEYTITDEDVAYPFLPAIPPDYEGQAGLPNLNFTRPEEMFGERFHMDEELLKALNPGVDMRRPGNVIVVADIVGQPVTGKIARIEADKRARQVRAYDAQNRLVVAYPATIGSTATPSPSGTHKVNTIAPEPVYYYNPDNFTTKKADRKLELPPGPNNPVGTMWIDLSKDGYGIHGTPEPSRIDKTASSGCIRLTNWDAEELATLVEAGITVTFVE